MQEIELGPNLPCLVSGNGPPLVLLPGYAPRNCSPTGGERWFYFNVLGGLRERRTVYLISRRPNAARGRTMSDIAADYAEALRAKFGRPVDVAGISVGAAAGLQLAIEHPDVVRRLAVAGGASAWSERGKGIFKEWQARVAANGHPSPVIAGVMTSSPVVAPFVRALLWFGDFFESNAERADGIATVDALLQYDCSSQLDQITAPTLVLGGECDPFCSPELFRATAKGIARGEARVYEGRGHGTMFFDKRFKPDLVSFMESA